MSLLGYFRLTKPIVPLVAGIAAAMGYWIVGGKDIPNLVIIFASTFLICAGGRALDDAFDAEYDKLYHPNRPIPQKKASARGAGILSAVLLTVGFVLSIFLGWACALLAFINVLLVIMYSTNFKRFPVLGNLSLAYLVGTIFLFGGLAAGDTHILFSGAIAVITFFEMLAYEVIKDGASVTEDTRTEGNSLSLHFGTRYSTITALIFTCIGIAFSYGPSVILGTPYLIMISVVNAIKLLFAIFALRAKDEESLRKRKVGLEFALGMVLTIAVFVISVLLGLSPYL